MIIGTSRQTYDYKAQRGNFTPSECKALCRHFHKSFDYLFATMDEIDEIDAATARVMGFLRAGRQAGDSDGGRGGVMEAGGVDAGCNQGATVTDDGPESADEKREDA